LTKRFTGRLSLNTAGVLRETKLKMMETINVKDVDVLKGVYLDFDNGPVFLLQSAPDNIMCVGADDTYRGESGSLEEILRQHDNIKYAKTLKGEQIVF